MATVRQHLSSMHEQSASHHGAMKKCEMAKAALHRSMHKAAMDAGQEHSAHDGLADQCEKAAGHHEAMESFHKAAMDECMKSVEADLNKLVPTQVSAVAPTNPWGIRPVTRDGQRPMNDAPAARPNVPIQFEKLVAVEDDE